MDPEGVALPCDQVLGWCLAGPLQGGLAPGDLPSLAYRWPRSADPWPFLPRGHLGRRCLISRPREAVAAATAASGPAAWDGGPALVLPISQ